MFISFSIEILVILTPVFCYKSTQKKLNHFSPFYSSWADLHLAEAVPLSSHAPAGFGHLCKPHRVAQSETRAYALRALFQLSDHLGAPRAPISRSHSPLRSENKTW